MNSDWFFALFAAFGIGRSNYFGFFDRYLKTALLLLFIILLLTLLNLILPSGSSYPFSAGFKMGIRCGKESGAD